jgi:hypothetical protein
VPPAVGERPRVRSGQVVMVLHTIECALAAWRMGGETMDRYGRMS